MSFYKKGYMDNRKNERSFCIIVKASYTYIIKTLKRFTWLVNIKQDTWTSEMYSILYYHLNMMEKLIKMKSFKSGTDVLTLA